MSQHTQSQLIEALAPFSDYEITSELLRRAEARAHEVDKAKALEILRNMPEALSPKWTVNKLCDLATEHDLSVTAAFSAWEELTAGGSPVPAIPGGFTVGQRVRDTESGARHTVLGAGLLTNHVLVRFNPANRDGQETGEFHVSYLEAVND